MAEYIAERLIVIAVFLLVAFPVHEFAHAFAAWVQGDATAKLFGRLTLDPRAHFDRVGGLMTVVTALASPLLLGWAKPTPVNTANLRDRRNGEVLVALAGPASNLLMATAAAGVARAADALALPLPPLVQGVIGLFVVMNVALAVFNLLPVPPLDGSTLLFRVLSPAQAWRVRPFLAQYGFVVLIVGVIAFREQLSTLVIGVARFLLGA